MSDLYRLVYTSFRKPECSEEEIKKILASCKKNNPSRNVTGILLHSTNRFIQYVEGAKEDIEELYQLIKTDHRHTSVNRRNFEPIKARVFPSWEMGYHDVDMKDVSFLTNITKQDKNTFEEILSGEIEFGDRGMRVLKLFFEN